MWKDGRGGFPKKPGMASASVREAAARMKSWKVNPKSLRAMIVSPEFGLWYFGGGSLRIEDCQGMSSARAIEVMRKRRAEELAQRRAEEARRAGASRREGVISIPIAREPGPAAAAPSNIRPRRKQTKDRAEMPSELPGASHQQGKGKGISRSIAEEAPRLPESLADSKRALKAFDEIPIDEVTLNGLVEYDPNWLNAMEINTYRNVALLKHIRLNFDESVTRMRRSQATKEAAQKEATEMRRKLEEAELERAQAMSAIQLQLDISDRERTRLQETVQGLQVEVATLKERPSAEEVIQKYTDSEEYFKSLDAIRAGMEESYMRVFKRAYPATDMSYLMKVMEEDFAGEVGTSEAPAPIAEEPAAADPTGSASDSNVPLRRKRPAPTEGGDEVAAGDPSGSLPKKSKETPAEADKEAAREES